MIKILVVKAQLDIFFKNLENKPFKQSEGLTSWLVPLRHSIKSKIKILK
jgi:hypothetical protein